MAGPGIPLFTLVRRDTIGSNQPTYYDGEEWVETAAGDELNRREEIRLVDNTGEPCAMPIGQDFRDEDLRFDFTDGSVARTPRIQRHEITLGCDFLEDATRRRILRWKHDRADVEFTPGYGPATEAAWRPLVQNGALFMESGVASTGETVYDLTGRHVVQNYGPSAIYVWDDWTDPNWPQMRQAWPDNSVTYSAPSAVVPTPYGAGQSLQNQIGNKWSPSSPGSATEGYGAGYAGWRKGGAKAADISFAWNEDGFGINEINTLRVTTTADTANALQRYIDTGGMWNPSSGDYQGYTFTGDGTVSVGVWIRGRLPYGSTLTLSATTEGVQDTVTFSGHEGTGWRRYSLHHSTTWSSSNFPIVRIDMPSTSYADRADFEIGPMMAGWCAACSFNVRWAKTSTSATYNDRIDISSGDTFTIPKAGSVTYQFYLPPGWWDHNTTTPHYLGLFEVGSVYGSSYLSFNSAGQARFSLNRNGASIVSSYMDVATGPHALSFIWGTSYVALVLDGVIVAEDTDGSAADISFTTGTQRLRVGNLNYGAHPLIPLSMRIDHDELRDEMKHIHAALTDPVALGTIVAARARTYEIVAVPSVPRIVDGATYWSGNLVLRQVSYDHRYRDITSQEV
jgi:hypothetical protein